MYTLIVIVIVIIVLTAIQLYYKLKNEDYETIEQKEKAKKRRKKAMVIDSILGVVLSIISLMRDFNVIKTIDIEETSSPITVISTAGDNTTEPTTEPTTESTTESTTKFITTERPTEIASKHLIKGFFDEEGQVKQYSYEADITGTYYFDLDIVSPDKEKNYNYSVTIYNPNDFKTKDSSSYRDYDKGITVKLEKGKEYLIEIESLCGKPTYIINVGVPE